MFLTYISSVPFSLLVNCVRFTIDTQYLHLQRTHRNHNQSVSHPQASETVKQLVTNFLDYTTAPPSFLEPLCAV